MSRPDARPAGRTALGRSKAQWGYDEARRIDYQINVLLKVHPVNAATKMEWLKFARTIATTSEVIIAMVKERA